MLRRVEQVNRTAERVVAGDLSDRVPRAGTNDEFDQLAANLNGMLDQIERLMTAMREVTDNVAHDLKTPLARLRARLELALLGSQDGAAQSEAIRAAIEEADRLLATFNALLSIAEAEAGAGGRRGERLDLAEIVGAAVELYEPLAEENGIALRFDGMRGTIIEGDRHLLSQAVANLLDNALKYGGGKQRRRDRGRGAAARRSRAYRSRRSRTGHRGGGSRKRVRSIRAAGAEPQHRRQRPRSKPGACRGAAAWRRASRWPTITPEPPTPGSR